jgi:hypothetical protein
MHAGNYYKLDRLFTAILDDSLTKGDREPEISKPWGHPADPYANRAYLGHTLELYVHWGLRPPDPPKQSACGLPDYRIWIGNLA